MEAIKGLARRTSQSLKEKVSRVDANPEDTSIEEVARKVSELVARSRSISEKLSYSIRLLEDLGKTLKEIGEEHRQAPDLAVESRQLAESVYEIGIRLIELSSEHRIGLQSNCIDLLTHFTKECVKLSNLEDVRRCNRLEYNFFKSKVNRLREKPPKDFSRIPRNEQILENWRIELSRATENYKIFSSQLYLKGRQSLDRSVFTMVQVLKSFFEGAFMRFRQIFSTSRLPEYPTNPILRPTPLPPDPPPAPQFAVSGASYPLPGGSHAFPRDEQEWAASRGSPPPLEGNSESVDDHAAGASVDANGDGDVSPQNPNDAALHSPAFRSDTLQRPPVDSSLPEVTPSRVSLDYPISPDEYERW
ncbi:unnamed protein product [Phytomonas sp. EM1]|nr:unnamed protein product [Phytomonas sp. EM1]|eukprot:CCW61519.1 unnamed protein product [Phytomonas sp. isolate EM1]